MGIFDFLKKGRKDINPTTDNGMPGPTYFDGLTEHIERPKKLLAHEWRRKLKMSSGVSKFKIRFYGKLHERYPNLIIGTEFAPSSIFAVDISTGQEVLLFDGCKHGYNAMFCESFSNEQQKDRKAETFFADKEGKDVFEVIISTYNGNYFDDEFATQVDGNGQIELVDGSKVELEVAKRNSFDTLQIFAVNENGNASEIVSEELA